MSESDFAYNIYESSLRLVKIQKVHLEDGIEKSEAPLFFKTVQILKNEPSKEMLHLLVFQNSTLHSSSCLWHQQHQSHF